MGERLKSFLDFLVSERVVREALRKKPRASQLCAPHGT